MTTNVKQRLQLFLEYKRISQSAFERTCGFSHGYVSNIRRSPSASACSLIALQFPELNIKWLTTGAGHMLSSEDMSIPVPDNERTRYEEMIVSRDKRIKELESTILNQQRTIDLLRIKAIK